MPGMPALDVRLDTPSLLLCLTWAAFARPEPVVRYLAVDLELSLSISKARYAKTALCCQTKRGE